MPPRGSPKPRRGGGSNFRSIGNNGRGNDTPPPGTTNQTSDTFYDSDICALPDPIPINYKLKVVDKSPTAQPIPKPSIAVGERQSPSNVENRLLANGMNISQNNRQQHRKTKIHLRTKCLQRENSFKSISRCDSSVKFLTSSFVKNDSKNKPMNNFKEYDNDTVRDKCGLENIVKNRVINFNMGNNVDKFINSTVDVEMNRNEYPEKNLVRNLAKCFESSDRYDDIFKQSHLACLDKNEKIAIEFCHRL